ncbi:phosphotransferase [Nonomuraea sp. NPDC050547]|uniref:phosphotransferase n=1 Tax=unclassified Nonomuraea TaxID=2593643 RepID=UPI0037AC6250
MKMHADELAVPLDTVRALVAGQFPEWKDLPVRRVAGQGTVNAIFRIGEDLAARFPLEAREPGAARRWLEAEAAAARELLDATRFRTPAPIALGEPGEGYPLPWSVQTWLPGAVATDEDPGESVAFARDLAELIAGLRAVETRGRRFTGGGRGGDLTTHDAWVDRCLRESEHLLDVPRLRATWTALRTLPREAADVMNHGDLIPGNVLVSAGRLAGVLDVGGFGPADPALDLVGAWHLLESGPRAVLRERVGGGDLEWARGRAWAFIQAIGLVWYYLDSNPGMSEMGRRTLDRVLADAH